VKNNSMEEKIVFSTSSAGPTEHPQEKRIEM